jgi:hypothetical protein
VKQWIGLFLRRPFSAARVTISMNATCNTGTSGMRLADITIVSPGNGSVNVKRLGWK